jgi:hypothetical protein
MVAAPQTKRFRRILKNVADIVADKQNDECRKLHENQWLRGCSSLPAHGTSFVARAIAHAELPFQLEYRSNHLSSARFPWPRDPSIGTILSIFSSRSPPLICHEVALIVLV